MRSVFPMQDVERTLRASQLFAGVDGATLTTLAAQTTRRRLVRGESLWRALEPISCVSIIVSGLVKIVRADESSIVSIFGAHEAIGLLGLLSDGVYLADAVAASAVVEVARVDAKLLLATVHACPALAHSLNASLASLSRALDEKIRIMSAGPVERRLATLLLCMLDRFGDELEGGTHIVPVSLTRAELASLIGSTVETLIRTMSRWQKAGTVRTTRDGFSIDDVSLLEAICSPRRNPACGARVTPIRAESSNTEPRRAHPVQHLRVDAGFAEIGAPRGSDERRLPVGVEGA